MNCEQTRELLDDLVDGTIHPDEARAARDHLGQCPDCRAERQALEKLLADLRDLPESIDPSRDLWPEVDRRLDEVAPGATPIPFRPRAMPRLVRWAALAASLVALAGLGQWALRSGGDPTERAGDPVAEVGSPATRVPDTGDVRPAAATPPDPPSQAVRALDQATEELRRALEVQREALPAATRDVVDHNLAIIETAISEIERAMDERPDDPELNRRLLAYREREVALLRAASRAANRLES